MSFIKENLKNAIFLSGACTALIASFGGGIALVLNDEFQTARVRYNVNEVYRRAAGEDGYLSGAERVKMAQDLTGHIYDETTEFDLFTYGRSKSYYVKIGNLVHKLPEDRVNQYLLNNKDNSFKPK